MKEIPNYFSILTAEVRYDKNLKDKAKLLYSEITALSDKYGYCYASNKYFAELYGVTPTTISLLIKDLVDNGYIESEIIYKEGSKEILNRYLKIVKGGYLKNLKEGYLKKVKDNNININNTSINIKEDIDIKKGIFDFIEENYNRTLSPLEYEKIQNWLEEMPEDMIKYAIELSVMNNAKKFTYVEAILNNWKSEGFKTLNEVKQEKIIKPVNKELFDYDWLNETN